MRKHTPGPWWVEIGDETDPWSHQWPRIVSDEYEVVGTEGFYGDFETDCANARLIAAAPELLEALDALTGGMDTDFDSAVTHRDYMVSLHWVRAARAAIAKATGEQQ